MILEPLPSLPCKRNSAHIALYFKWLLALGMLLPHSTGAFVILDTSEPGVPNSQDSTTSEPIVAHDSASSKSVVSAPPLSQPKYANAFFMSADNKLVYAYLGVIKAMEEFGLQPDAMVAESKAVWLGASWALGYSALEIETQIIQKPLEYFLTPFPRKTKTQETDFLASGMDPLQFDIPLDVKRLQQKGSRWSDVLITNEDEYLHLSWMVAQLTFNAKGGRVADLAETARRLVISVSDLNDEKRGIVTEGDLQSILKGSLLPSSVVRERPRLRPYASANLMTGHDPSAPKIPFQINRIIMVVPGQRLRPPPLEGRVVPWTDSLNFRTNTRATQNASPAAAYPEMFLGTGESQTHPKILRIELEPNSDFNPAEPDPKKWIDLGYTSALRSMDILKSAMGKNPVAEDSAGKGLSGDTLVGKTPARTDDLGFSRVAVNTLASGGRQLLLDIVKTAKPSVAGSTEAGPISELIHSKLYSHLDVDWIQTGNQDEAFIVFDAQEKSKINFVAGWNVAFLGEGIADRPPELYAGLTWREPFYIPFQGEMASLLGGHQPGYQARFFIAPIYPLRLELGVSRVYWDINYPALSTTAAISAGALQFRLKRTVSEFFLKIFPLPSLHLLTTISSHEMSGQESEDPYANQFLSMNFKETGFLGLGNPNAAGIYPHALQVQYRNLNRVNTFGQVKPNISSLESRIRISLGDFRLSDQYYWSNQKNQELMIFDLVEAGEIDVFTFQKEFFLAYLRAASFRDVKVEYNPTFGKIGLRIILGAYRKYGVELLETNSEPPRLWDRKELPFQGHWEGQAAYTTPWGTLRAGMGGLEGSTPFYFLRVGAGFKLGFEDNP